MVCMIVCMLVVCKQWLHVREAQSNNSNNSQPTENAVASLVIAAAIVVD